MRDFQFARLVALCTIAIVSSQSLVKAQYTERELVRKGNSLYNDSLFVKAEEYYLRALDKNNSNSVALYNLGNAYLEQQKVQEALDQYKKVAKLLNIEKDRLLSTNSQEESELTAVKERLATVYHNTGVLHHATQDYAKAIEAYKEALRNNPKDNETRYNLIHAMKQQQNQQDSQQEDRQDKQEKQDKEQNQQPENQQNKEQNQNQDQDRQQEEMSQETAEQLLEAAMQDEKELQERMMQQIKVQSKGELDKDW